MPVAGLQTGGAKKRSAGTSGPAHSPRRWMPATLGWPQRACESTGRAGRATSRNPKRLPRCKVLPGRVTNPAGACVAAQCVAVFFDAHGRECLMLGEFNDNTSSASRAYAGVAELGFRSSDPAEHVVSVSQYRHAAPRHAGHLRDSGGFERVQQGPGQEAHHPAPGGGMSNVAATSSVGAAAADASRTAHARRCCRHRACELSLPCGADLGTASPYGMRGAPPRR